MDSFSGEEEGRGSPRMEHLIWDEKTARCGTCEPAVKLTFHPHEHALHCVWGIKQFVCVCSQATVEPALRGMSSVIIKGGLGLQPQSVCVYYWFKL